MRLRQLSILAALPLAACLALASPTHYAMRADTSDEEASTSPSLEVPVVHKGKEFDMASAPPRPVVEQVDTSSVGHKSKPLDLPEVMPSSSSSATAAAEKLPVEEPPSQPFDWDVPEAAPVAAAPTVPPPAYKGKLIDPLDPPIAEALTHEAVPEDDALPQPLNDTWSSHVDVQDDSSAPVHKGKPFSPFDTPIWDIPYRPRPHHKKPKPHHKAANHTEGGRLKGDAQVDRREAVKRAFLFNYEAYEKYAWGSDLLKPIAKEGVNNSILAGWGGSIVDSLTTMIVMGLEETDMFDRALQHTRHIDFTWTEQGDPVGAVSIFELTIRYIGGMLSTYQLLGEKYKYNFLVEQAQSLADGLSHGWYQGNRLPFNSINLNRGAAVDLEAGVLIAEAGTLLLEWCMLSMFSGNQTYARLAYDSMNAIVETPSAIFPGLPPMVLDAFSELATGDPEQETITWGGGSDSFWEIALKYPYMMGETDSPYIDYWKQAINSSIEHLLVKTEIGEHTFLAEYINGSAYYIDSHLAAFAGGNWLLGSALLDLPYVKQYGLDLAESSWRTYNATATGLGPEAWFFRNSQGYLSTKPDFFQGAGRKEFEDEHGFFISSSASYSQRPEMVESLFYAWRITGEEKWRNMAWQAFEAMEKYLSTPQGWVGLVDVNSKTSAFYDELQTFALAETLKYLYLMFDDSNNYSLDEWVFTTEAHPFRVKMNAGFGHVQYQGNRYRPVQTTHFDAFATQPEVRTAHPAP